MRVCFLTHYYPPEVGAPQARIEALARGLAARGAEITVHTGFPHYPAGEILPPYRNRPFQVEQDGPLRIVRTAVYPAPNRGFGRRLANHVSLCASALAGARLSGPADVVVVESPPLFTAAAGVAYAALKRAALITNVADQWPASAVELGALRSPGAIAAAERLERFVYARSAAITVPTAGLVEALSRIEPARGKVERLGPSVDPERFDPAPPDPAGPLRVLYAGTIGMAQGVETLLEAARLAGPDVVSVTLAGDGHDAAELRAAIDAGRFPNARMVGTVAHDRMPALYRGSDVAAVLLRDRPIFAGALPTKLIEAMAAGRPVALSARGESADLVRETGAGVVSAPEDPAALAASLAELAGDRARLTAMGAAGRAAVERRFSRAVVLDRLEELVESAAGARSRRRARRAGARP